MSRSYSTVTVQGPTQPEIAEVVAGLKWGAYLSPTVGGRTVVYPDVSGRQDDSVQGLAAVLSAGLRCAALAAVSADDATLWYGLYDDGDLVDEYESAPHALQVSGPAVSQPVGGDAYTLCRIFGAGGAHEVEAILQAPGDGPDGYPFAVDRHADLAASLGLPLFGVDIGYADIASGLDLDRSDISAADMLLVRP